MRLTKGGAYMLTAISALSVMHLTVKFLSHVPVWEIIFCRSVFSLTACIPVFLRLKISPWGNNKPLLILRGVSGMAGLAFFFYSIHNIPLSSAITIGNLMPFFTLFLAAVFLKKRIRFLQWVCLLVAFSGVVVIKGFDGRISFNDLVIAVSGAFFAGTAHFLVRTLKETDHTSVIVFYLPLVTIPVALFFSVSEWVWPGYTDWGLLLLNGVFTHIGQLYLTKAYGEEEVNRVAGIYFLGIVFAIFFGFLLFNESISLSVFSGILMIGTSVWISFIIREKKPSV